MVTYLTTTFPLFYFVSNAICSFFFLPLLCNSQTLLVLVLHPSSLQLSNLFLSSLHFWNPEYLLIIMEFGKSQMYELDVEAVEETNSSNKRCKFEDGAALSVAVEDVPVNDDVPSLLVASEDIPAATDVNVVLPAVPEDVPTDENIQDNYMVNVEAGSKSGGLTYSSGIPVALDLVLTDEDAYLADEGGSNSDGSSDSSTVPGNLNIGELPPQNEALPQLGNVAIHGDDHPTFAPDELDEDGYLADDEGGSNSDRSSDSSTVPGNLNIGEFGPQNEALLQLGNVAIHGDDHPAFAPDELDEDGYMADDEASSESNGGSVDSSAAESGLTQVSNGSDNSV